MTRLGGHGLDHVFLRVRSRTFSEVTRSWTDSTGPDDAGAAGVVELADRTGEQTGMTYTAVGEPERLARLLGAIVPGDTVRSMSATRGTGALAGEILSSWGLGPATTWDRMVTETAPPVLDPGRAVVVELDLDRDVDEIADLLAEANPGARQAVRGPGARRARWYGIRLPSDGPGGPVGTLVAAGSATPVPGGGVHLGSIGTLPAFRGHGYAGALTARMTADGVAEHGLVTLGLYDDNVAARRVYERLGFVVVHEVETWNRV